jgi:hypothetical protein
VQHTARFSTVLGVEVFPDTSFSGPKTTKRSLLQSHFFTEQLKLPAFWCGDHHYVVAELSTQKPLRNSEKLPKTQVTRGITYSFLVAL